jgi:hypothetical protein
MSNSELRNNLHGFIDNVKDEKFLRVVHAMMKEYLENSDITEEEKKLLNERLDHYEANPTHTESWNDLKSRLQNKKSA